MLPFLMKLGVFKTEANWQQLRHAGCKPGTPEGRGGGGALLLQLSFSKSSFLLYGFKVVLDHLVKVTSRSLLDVSKAQLELSRISFTLLLSPMAMLVSIFRKCAGVRP